MENFKELLTPNHGYNNSYTADTEKLSYVQYKLFKMAPAIR